MDNTKSASVIKSLQIIESTYMNAMAHKVLAHKPKTIQELRDEYRTAIEKLSLREQVKYFFGNQTDTIQRQSSQMVCVCVVKDELNLDLLVTNLATYSFDVLVIIDDRSTTAFPLDKTCLKHLYILNVRQGFFGLAKTLWIESICNLCFEKCWVATIDADEYFEVNTFYSRSPSLRTVSKTTFNIRNHLSKTLHPVVPFCLLDVTTNHLSSDRNILLDKKLDYFLSRPPLHLLRAYSKESAVRWSFGPDCFSQCMTDIRSHVFGITESRSKMSLIFWRRSSHIQLHQGFHNVHFRKQNKMFDFTWARKNNVATFTILHAKILYSALNQPDDKKLAEYFPRTAENIRALGSQLANPSCIDSARQMLHPYMGSIFMPSWIKPGKLLVTSRNSDLVNQISDRFGGTYELQVVGQGLFHKLLQHLDKFTGMKLVKIDRDIEFVKLATNYFWPFGN